MFSMCSLATYWLNLRPDPSPNNKSLGFSIFAGKYRTKQNEKRVGKQSKRFGKICLGNFQVMSFSLLAAISVLHVAVCVCVGHLWLHAHIHKRQTRHSATHTHTQEVGHTRITSTAPNPWTLLCFTSDTAPACSLHLPPSPPPCPHPTLQWETQLDPGK